jgi:hypothetical protein
MKHIKLYEQFLNEAASATSMWQDGDQMLDDCKSFLMSNLPFKYSDVIHPEPGYGSYPNEFQNMGLLNLQVILKDGLFFNFGRHMKSKGILDFEYRSVRSDYVKNYGREVKFIFFSGTNAINRGFIAMSAGGEYYKIGSYEDPNGFKNMMKKIWSGMQSSDNDEQFEQFMKDLNMPIVAAKVIDSAWVKEWRAQK